MFFLPVDSKIIKLGFIISEINTDGKKLDDKKAAKRIRIAGEYLFSCR